MRRILIILLLSLPLLAQSPPTNSRTIYIDVTEKPLGAQINSLRPQDFRVRIDNHNVPVASVERKVLKPKVVILFDTSGSAGVIEKWNAELDLGIAIVRSLQPIAEVAFLPFSDKKLPLKLHADPTEVLTSLESFRKPANRRDPVTRGRTALRDAIMFAISTVQLGPTDAILIISDGGENSSHNSEKEYERELFSSGARVISIVMGTGGDTAEEAEGYQTLVRIAKRSGGLAAQFGRSSPRQDAFVVLPREQQRIPDLSAYIARRIVNPYAMKLDVPPTVSGKLKIELVDANGKRRKGMIVSAPERIESGPQ